MRPKFSLWSDYGAPAHKHWMSAPKKGTRTSIGPMILLAAVMVVAGVIGISGIYPQIIDAEWVQDTGTHPPKMSLSSPHATRKRSGIVASARRAMPSRLSSWVRSATCAWATCAMAAI